MIVLKQFLCLLFLALALLSCKRDACPNCIIDIENGSNDLVEVRIDGVVKYTLAPGEIATESLIGGVTHRLEGRFLTAFPHTDYDILLGCNGGCKVDLITLMY